MSTRREPESEPLPVRSLMLIGIGTVGLAAIVTLILNQVEASGVAYSLDMVLSLCVGGFANYMVNERH